MKPQNAEIRNKVDLYLDETSYKAFSGHYLLASAGLRLRPILRPGQQRMVFKNAEYGLQMDVYRAQHKVPILTDRSMTSARTLAMGRGVGVGFRLSFPLGQKQYLLMPSDTGLNQRIAGSTRRLEDATLSWCM